MTANKDDIYYKAMLARDSRFDGIFYIGVKTTGIYCRPICPAQPKRKNIQFYPHAHAAEVDGYRPCLRCRPECAPQSAAWLGTSAIVRRALNIIHSSSHIHDSEEVFASRFGLSARHLRRLFQEEIGRTPKQVIDIQRINFARQLIIESPMSLTKIAFLSGFGSVRRFNDAIKRRFERTPSELRKNRHSQTSQQSKQITLQLSYRPPFPWQDILQPFKAHEIEGIENITQEHYERLIKINGHVMHIKVGNNVKRNQLTLTVTGDDFSQLYSIVQKVRQMFDIDSDPLVIHKTMQQHHLLKKLYKKHPGLRLPTGWDPFEIAISTILGQLVSIKRANQLCKQLIDNYGEKITHPITQKSVFLFPKPENIINGSLDEVGTTGMRKKALKNFCQAIVDKNLSLDPHQEYSSFITNCLKIKGIGPWTAEYIAMKALGITDAFPKEDLIIKRMLKENSNIETDKFKPWRAYLTMYLWKHNQQQTTKL